LKAFAEIASLPASFDESLRHLRPAAVAGGGSLPDGKAHTADLFEAAWTHYDDATYEHSVGLVKARLEKSGFDKVFFSGATCFDGGCGTGRLSIAMAEGGAKEVVAADIGGESLEYFRRVVARRGLSNIRIVEQDVTDLSGLPSNSFDFVASNGVLHHTTAPDRGIVEHFRITRPGGTFWLYLYGAGGIYWNTYDRLKPIVRGIASRKIREMLSSLDIRQGLIYTYMDNLLAPRVYYRLNQVLDLLRPCAAFEFVHAKGAGPIDDTTQLLACRWGSEVFGSDGEVRIVIKKSTSRGMSKALSR
jgi:ubiquinone/menaquinone biosynthesis C-methylase UbiE